MISIVITECVYNFGDPTSIDLTVRVISPLKGFINLSFVFSLLTIHENARFVERPEAFNGVK
jgi:hypothetical protein